MYKKFKKAFSLIELLVVILIITLLYTLSIDNLKDINESTDKVSLENLKEFMLEQEYKSSVELKCMNGCSSCSLHVDSNKTIEMESFVDNSIEIYRYNFSLGMIAVEQQSNNCFSYKINKRGTGEQLFIKYKKKIYNFSNYFTPINTYETLSQAQKAQEETIQEILQ